MPGPCMFAGRLQTLRDALRRMCMHRLSACLPTHVCLDACQPRVCLHARTPCRPPPQQLKPSHAHAQPCCRNIFPQPFAALSRHPQRAIHQRLRCERPRPCARRAATAPCRQQCGPHLQHEVVVVQQPVEGRDGEGGGRRQQPSLQHGLTGEAARGHVLLCHARLKGGR
jgi:hypothetical protein